MAGEIRRCSADIDSQCPWLSTCVPIFEEDAHHFCKQCGCATFSDSPAFEPDGSWEGETRRIGVNARLFDAFEAADYPAEIIDGKNLW